MRWEDGQVHMTSLETRNASVQECNGVKSVCNSTASKRERKREKEREGERQRDRKRERKREQHCNCLYSGRILTVYSRRDSDRTLGSNVDALLKDLAPPRKRSGAT